MRNFLRWTMAVALTAIWMSSVVRADDWAAILGAAQAQCDEQQAAIHDITVVEEMVAHTPDGEMAATQTLYRKGEKSRMEMVVHKNVMGMENMQTIVINSGDKAWMFNSFTGKTEMDPEDADQASDFQDCWGFTPENSKVVGSGEAQGRDCWIVDMVRDSVQHKLWLDKERLFVIQGESHDEEAGIRWALSDFRKINGKFDYPHKIEMFDGDEPVSTMTVTSVKINDGLADDLFDPEKVEMKTVDMEELMKQMMQEAEPDTQ
ncbi:MAG: outer membrane lipoprotein-sorting protein [Calditrichota bacterium]